MNIPFFQVDAFASKPLLGNPAAVMVIDRDLPDETLQNIAAENNLSETAYIWENSPDNYDLRWFTPTTEVALCGHATLAAAHVILKHLTPDLDGVRFQTRQSGTLICTKSNSGYRMDFPAQTPTEADNIDENWEAALGKKPAGVWFGNFTAIQLENPNDLTSLNPNIAMLADLGGQASQGRGNIGVFALDGNGTYDVVSRFFAPGSGIDEDPATGSWHCLLPLIAQALTGKSAFNCLQAFPNRGADIGVEILPESRIGLSGQAYTLIEGAFKL